MKERAELARVPRPFVPRLAIGVVVSESVPGRAAVSERGAEGTKAARVVGWFG